jgi:DNA replication protein DnaC
VDLRYQLALSAIPDEYRTYTMETLPSDRETRFTFDPTKPALDLREYARIAGERKTKNGVYLTSPTTGNGKSELACAIAMSFIVARTRKALREGVDVGQLVQFVNTTELLDLLRAAMNDDGAQAKATALIGRIERAPLVCLDDLGSERPSEWVAERFYSIINGIWARRAKQTLIATSNKSLQAIEATLGPRVRSRIDGLTIVCELRGDDRRRKTY